MKIRDVKEKYGDVFHGDVVVSLQDKGCKTMVRATLTDPEIAPTPIGLIFTSGDDRFDVDFRNANDHDDGSDNYCEIEYENGLFMAIMFYSE